MGTHLELQFPPYTLSEWFEIQAGKSPDDCAVICEGRQLAYGELNRRANQLARHLQGLGVGPNNLVGLMVERSVDMMVALLAILKAGGAYVPLDPSFPQGRLNYMVENSGMRVLVTHRNLDQQLSVKPVGIVRLDVDSPAFARQAGDNIMCTKIIDGEPSLCLVYLGLNRQAEGCGSSTFGVGEFS